MLNNEDLILDFSQVKEGFEAIAKGIYEAYFFDLVKGMSVNNAPKLDITFKISEGPYKGRMLWLHPSLQPQSLWRIKRILSSVGTKLELTGKVKVSQIINALKNKPCRIIVDCDPRKDFPNSVTDVLPSRGDTGFGGVESKVKDESKVKTGTYSEDIEKKEEKEKKQEVQDFEREEELSEEDLPT